MAKRYRAVRGYTDAECERFLLEARSQRKPPWPICVFCEIDYHPENGHFLAPDCCDSCGIKWIESKLRRIRGRDTAANRSRVMKLLAGLETEAKASRHHRCKATV